MTIAVFLLFINKKVKKYYDRLVFMLISSNSGKKKLTLYFTLFKVYNPSQILGNAMSLTSVSLIN